MNGLLPAELNKKKIDETTLKRMGAPEDIAAAVKFLIGEEAAFITGHVLDVNGGIYM
jgi:3-oxoacyl-[acyl-carrier protein] reductase